MVRTDQVHPTETQEYEEFLRENEIKGNARRNLKRRKPINCCGCCRLTILQFSLIIFLTLILAAGTGVLIWYLTCYEDDARLEQSNRSKSLQVSNDTLTSDETTKSVPEIEAKNGPSEEKFTNKSWDDPDTTERKNILSGPEDYFETLKVTRIDHDIIQDITTTEKTSHISHLGSACNNNKCLNGICIQDYLHSNTPPGYHCTCAKGYTGKFCDKLTSISMTNNDSYVALETPDFSKLVKFDIKFVTKEDFGVLLYIQSDNSQHLAVEIFRGRIMVSFSTGSYPVKTMFSHEMVNDQRFHHLELIVNKNVVTMILENGEAKSIFNGKESQHIRTDKPLYLGGLNPKSKSLGVGLWHLRNADSLKGCLSQVEINGEVLDFLSDRVIVRHKVAAGC